MDILLVGYVVLMAAIVIALLMPRVISVLRLCRRAAHDYRVARGTQHLKQLEGPFSKLEREIRATQNETRTIKRKLDDLAGQREEELRKTLCTYLVTHRLTEVEGIGPRLQQRVVRYCFRGDLRDLRRVERVSGVGPTRQAAVMRWVRARERELPQLMKGPFPGKETVEKTYRARTGPLERRLDQARATLEEKQKLRDSARKSIDKLKSVQVSHFRKALRGHSPSEPPVPNWYLKGVHPAWESPPEWFTTLLSEYGG